MTANNSGSGFGNIDEIERLVFPMVLLLQSIQGVLELSTKDRYG